MWEFVEMKHFCNMSTAPIYLISQLPELHQWFQEGVRYEWLSNNSRGEVNRLFAGYGLTCTFIVMSRSRIKVSHKASQCSHCTVYASNKYAQFDDDNNAIFCSNILPSMCNWCRAIIIHTIFKNRMDPNWILRSIIRWYKWGRTPYVPEQ